MGSLRAKVIDLNRYTKKYPFVGAPKRLTYQGDEYMAIEVGSIFFDEAESGTLNFDAPFPDSNYQVIAQLRDGVENNTGGSNVVIWIDTTSGQNKVVINSSAAFTGYVDIVALRLGK